MELIDGNAYLVALHRAEWAISTLACATLAAITWALLSLRRHLQAGARWAPLVTALTVVGLAASFVGVFYLFLLAFEPFAQVPVWCQPPAPQFAYLLVGTIPVTTIIHLLVGRHRRPA
jgi:hypothetical protein